MKLEKRGAKSIRNMTINWHVKVNRIIIIIMINKRTDQTKPSLSTPLSKTIRDDLYSIVTSSECE